MKRAKHTSTTRLEDGRSIRFRSIDPNKFPHGTVARYVAKCRCTECRAALSASKRDRNEAARQKASQVVPSGPPGVGYIVRAGKQHQVKTCPGVGGAVCLRGAAWLRHPFYQRIGACRICVVRATVWNGLVSADRAREHLEQLSKRGVGYKTVADACDVARSLMQEVRAGKISRIRAQTERRILAVDEGCRADGSLIAGFTTRRFLRQILGCGFTQTRLSRELGCTSFVFSLTAIAEMKYVKAATALRVEKLWRRVKAGEFESRPRWVDASETMRMLREMLAAPGMTKRRLGALLGYPVNQKVLHLDKVREVTAAKVATFYAQFDEDEGEVEARPTYDDHLSIDDFATARPGSAA